MRKWPLAKLEESAAPPSSLQLARAINHLPFFSSFALSPCNYSSNVCCDCAYFEQAVVHAVHVAAEARAAAHDNLQAVTIDISGATGPHAQDINGRYSPTRERGLDGRTVYIKCDDDRACIEQLSHTSFQPRYFHVR